MMYLRFVTCLSVGLFGLSLVMMTIYDALLQDWDVVAEMRRWAHHWARKHRTRYVLMNDDRMQAPRLNTRLNQAERTPMSLPYPTQTAPEVILPPLPPRDLASV